MAFAAGVARRNDYHLEGQGPPGGSTTRQITSLSIQQQVKRGDTAVCERVTVGVVAFDAGLTDK